jgi:insulysin
MSEVAVAAFAESVEEKGINVDAAKWKEELFAHGEPLLTEVATYWQRVLAGEDSISSELSKDILAGLPRFTEASPALSDYEGKLRDGVVIVDDPKRYRSSSRLTEPPKPVVDWGDLPNSKL